MKLYNAFKAISKHLTPFTKKDLRTFTNACKDGDVEKVKEVLENKRLRFRTLPTDALPYIWKAEILDYLLKSPLSDEYHDINPRQLIKNASAYGYIEVIDYFFKNKKVDFDYELINEKILATANEYTQIEIVQYLLNSPEICKCLDLDKAYTGLFKSAFFHDKMDIIQYLIMDVKIKKNEEINEYLKIHSNSEYSRTDVNAINNLFELQDLGQSLNQNKKRNKL